MVFREKINELNENLKVFPEAEEVFSPKHLWLREHFLPCISIDLAEINLEWKGTKLHMVKPVEPYEGCIGEHTSQFHNEFIGANWLSFRLDENNQYEFLGEEGYFLRSPINKELRENLDKQIEEERKKWRLKNPELFVDTGDKGYL